MYKNLALRHSFLDEFENLGEVRLKITVIQVWQMDLHVLAHLGERIRHISRNVYDVSDPYLS